MHVRETVIPPEKAVDAWGIPIMHAGMRGLA